MASTIGEDPIFPQDYPHHWEADVLLSDGATVRVRPIRPDDGERLNAFHNRQSSESIYLRFFSARPRLSPKDIERFTTIDYQDRMAFVAILGDEMIGVARYDREVDKQQAEVAFITDDFHHGRGLATLLLEYLAAVARDHGLTHFTATTLPQNRKMLGVFKQAGFQVSTRFEDGVIQVLLGIEPTLESQAAIEDRERRAEARSIARLLSPRSVAVIGASRQRGSLGHEAFRNILAGGFAGPAYPVNPSAPWVLSTRTYPTVLDIPDEIDLAVIAVPVSEVLSVVEQCVEKEVKGLVIISAGFAEVGEAGLALQHKVVDLARSNGMRLVGPNCMGVINTAPTVSLRATFAPVAPKAGGVGFLSQSGTLGTAILEQLGELGLGTSSFLSLGNKADVSLNDLLQFWEQDERTDAVLLYLESFGNLRKFSRIARRVGRAKPIVSVTSYGARLDRAGDFGLPPEATLDALLSQTGVIRVSTLQSLFDVTRMLLKQPLPQGPRVAVVSNSSGPARLAVEATRGIGLEAAVLGEETQAAIAEAAPIATRTQSPLDLTHQARPGHYKDVLEVVLGDPDVDAVVAIYAPPLLSSAKEVVESIAEASKNSTKPVVAVVLGADARREEMDNSIAVPLFAFPEEAIRALGRVTKYRDWLNEQHGPVAVIEGVDADAAVELVQDALESTSLSSGDSLNLPRDQAVSLAATFGIHQIASRYAHNVEEAISGARHLGYPVVLKADGVARVAKTEAGGLAVDLYTDDEVSGAYTRMSEFLGEAMNPALVQNMLPSGVDVAIRLLQHASVGAVISIGMGGVVSGQIGFDALRFLPISPIDAERLIDDSLVGSQLPANSPERQHLVDLLLRIGALGEAVPELQEMKLNPVVLSPTEAAVTDIRVRLAEWTGPDISVRRIDPD